MPRGRKTKAPSTKPKTDGDKETGQDISADAQERRNVEHYTTLLRSSMTAYAAGRLDLLDGMLSRLASWENSLGGGGTSMAMYGSLRRGAVIAIIAILVNYLGATSESVIFDMGAGLGRLMLPIAFVLGARVWGMEIDENNVRNGNQKMTLETRKLTNAGVPVSSTMPPCICRGNVGIVGQWPKQYKLDLGDTTHLVTFCQGMDFNDLKRAVVHMNASLHLKGLIFVVQGRSVEYFKEELELEFVSLAHTCSVFQCGSGSTYTLYAFKRDVLEPLTYMYRKANEDEEQRQATAAASVTQGLSAWRGVLI